MGPGLIGSIHKFVAASFHPRKIRLPLYKTLHLLSSNVTVHPALQSGRMLMRDATARVGTMCPTSTVGRPGMAMSQTCVDITLLPLGKLMVIGRVATFLLLTLVFSIIKIDVAPVSAMACDKAILSAFNCSVIGLPNIMQAVAAMLGAATHWRAGKGLAQFALEQLDVTTVASSSSMMFSEKLGVGFKEST